MEKIIGKEYTKEQFLEAVPNARTVPQIFIDDKHVGGYNELLDFLESNTNCTKCFGRLHSQAPWA